MKIFIRTFFIFLFTSAGSLVFGQTKLIWTNLFTEDIRTSELNGSNVSSIYSSPGNTPAGIAIDEANNHIYFTEWFGTSNIRRIDFNGGNLQTLVPNSPEANVIALDLVNGKMYWTDWGDADIRMANLDGTSQQIIISTGVLPEGIAVDPAGGKIYWGNRGGLGIMSANLDGTGVSTLVGTTNDVRAVNLDLTNGKIYWTDVGTGKIQRSNLDGTSVQDLYTGTAFGPWGLELDVPNNIMYWTDVSAGLMFTSELDGSNAQSSFSTGFTNPAFLDRIGVPPVQPVPTVSEWMLIGLGIITVFLGLLFIRRI